MKYIVLSFDDGKKDFYTRAFPVLQQYGLPAVLNVIPDFIDGAEPEKWVSWEELAICMAGGIEIANHSANHTNEPQEIIRGAVKIRQRLRLPEKIGFASPRSGVCRGNFDRYEDLLVSGHAAYIRSGNQLRRDGHFRALLYLIYRYTGWKWAFCRYNRGNILHLDQAKPDIFPSVTCNRDNSMGQVICLIEGMPENSACVLMLHSILAPEDDGYGKGKWTNRVEDFAELCKYLAKNPDVSVITQMQLCDLMK